MAENASSDLTHPLHLAPVEHEVHDLIKGRWSPRAFSSKPVELETLWSLLEAARWSASSANEQPWRFFVALREHRESFDRLLSCLAESNVIWAQHAPALMISVAHLNSEATGNPNRYALHDVGQASATMAIQAVALGLEIHQMAGFSHHKAREVLSIPENYEAVAAIAVGYPGDPNSLPEKYRERELAPRKRRPLREFVFGDSWGQTPPGLREK